MACSISSWLSEGTSTIGTCVAGSRTVMVLPDLAATQTPLIKHLLRINAFASRLSGINSSFNGIGKKRLHSNYVTPIQHKRPLTFGYVKKKGLAQNTEPGLVVINS